MKLSTTVLSLAALMLAACHKDDSGSGPAFSYDDVKIASISDVPAFIYEGDRLVAMGNEKFSYDDKGRIVGSRMEHRDTVNNLVTGYVYKTSFMWANGLCAGSIGDSLYSYTKDLDGNIKDVNFASGIVLSNYDYSLPAGRLNAITFTPGGWTTAVYTSIKYEYDAKGNIIKAVTRQPNLFGRPGSPAEMVITITFQYDNHPNPFYATYKKYGLILPALQRFANCISPNNVIKMQLKVDNMVELVLQYTYEYNEAGYPVKIITNGGNAGGQATYITYR